MNVKTLVVLFPEASVFEHVGDDVCFFVAHSVRITLRKNPARMVGSIDADHIQKPGRPHRPAEFLHHLVNPFKVHSFFYESGKSCKVRKQYPVHQKTRTVVDHHRAFTKVCRIGHGPGYRPLTALPGTDHFHQRHPVYRIEKMHTTETLWIFKTLSKFCDGDGGSIGGKHRVFRKHLLRFLVNLTFYCFKFHHRFNDQVGFFEAVVGEARSDSGQGLSHFSGFHPAPVHPALEDA